MPTIAPFKGWGGGVRTKGGSLEGAMMDCCRGPLTLPHTSGMGSGGPVQCVLIGGVPAQVGVSLCPFRCCFCVVVFPRGPFRALLPLGAALLLGPVFAARPTPSALSHLGPLQLQAKGVVVLALYLVRARPGTG